MRARAGREDGGDGSRAGASRAPSWRRRAGAAASLALLVLGLAGCAGLDTDRHLAPLYTELSLAGGDRGIEALGGSVLVRFDGETDRLEYWALRPLVSHRKEAPGRTFTWFLPPLGQRFRRPEETVTQLLPVWRFAKQHPEGEVESFQFLTLPGIYWARDADGDRKQAFFLFYGDVEHFLGWDKARWILFPFYGQIQRYGRTTHNVLWPFVQWSTGTGGRSWRIWPLYGDLGWDGHYRRRFFLWPFFTWQHNDQARAEGQDQRSLFLYPFFGLAEREHAESRTFLWPFFGYAHDDRTGFWAWDGPWPVVVFQGGDPERATRHRVWPFYSFYEGDGLTSTWYVWPLYNQRHEDMKGSEKRSRYLFPFWQQWDREYDGGLEARWRKFWPLFRAYSDEAVDAEMFAFPALNPMRRYDFVDEHYAWLWELYSAQRQYDRVRERSWLGLFRRERDRDEDRRSVTGLWGERRYTWRGKRVRETSLLLGLIRWRWTEGEGRDLMWPALPGPGWPQDRVPTSRMPEGAPRR